MIEYSLDKILHWIRGTRSTIKEQRIVAFASIGILKTSILYPEEIQVLVRKWASASEIESM